MQLYKPKDDIKSHQGEILFFKDKEYKFNNRKTIDEFNCIRVFTEKEMTKYFIEVPEAQ